MTRLRNRLIAAFLASTLLPLAATVAITTTLLDRSLRYSTTDEIDRLSRTLETTARQFYQRERTVLKADALSGRASVTTFASADAASWPASVRAFWDSREPERFGVSGPGGDRLDYLRRIEGTGVALYSRELGGVKMEDLSAQLRETRRLVDENDARDLRRGFTLTLLGLLGAAWLISLVPLVMIAQRVSRPIRQLTAALATFAAGDWSRRLDSGRRRGAARDEVGLAVDAFNRMADQLQENRDRLVQLTRLASWQSLARKTAHELKNSLTPIRLTVEEIQARQPQADRAFVDQAVQIVISEIESLERRVRAFSEFASEPPANPEVLDVNALVAERVALLRPAHPESTYRLELDGRRPLAYAAPDLVKGILTNLLQNAAEAAGPAGSIVALTHADGRRVAIEVHDSGPGLSDEAAATLFEPTITFKKEGMGLGLSIARKNALLTGGDIALIDGALGGAAFRVTLPAAAEQLRERLA
jgi:nitrogen fixation/metabolism regulation signal transduction histidine kinase